MKTKKQPVSIAASHLTSHISPSERMALAIKIVNLLDGVAIGQALSILEGDVPLLIKDGHCIHVKGSRMTKLRTRYGNPDNSRGEGE